MRRLTFTLLLLFMMLTARSQTFNFSYSGQIDTFIVPPCVFSLHITARGAEGGFHTSSAIQPGKGAMMSGYFAVNPGDTLLILVGEQPSFSNNQGNGGGGGTFVATPQGLPLIVAGGGGGSSQDTDSPDKHGNTTTSGGLGAGGGGTGGINGNGGNSGPSGFQSGAGGGFYTDGANGWTSNSGGLAFLNGGAGATANSNARGGFGGGGSGSAYIVGGGGGGYSGGGSGSNVSGSGVGGGGGSYNAGTNPVDSTGVNSGHGSLSIDISSAIVAVSGYLQQPVLCHDSASAIVMLQTSGGGAPYLYNFNGNGPSADSLYHNLAAGTYWFTVSDACGNTSDTSYISIQNADSIYAIITLSPEINGADGSIQANGNGGSGPLQYTINGGTPQASGTFSGLSGGIYILNITDSIGCSRNYVLALPSEVSIGEAQHAGIKLYPNPVSDVLNIQMPAGVNGTELRITDARGIVVRRLQLQGQNLFSINLEDLVSGFYQVHISNNGETLYKGKIIK